MELKMKKALFFLTLLLASFSPTAEAKNEPSNEMETVDNSIIIDRIGNEDIQISIPSPIFAFTDADIKIKFNNPSHTRLLLNKNKVEFIINGEPRVLDFVNGEASFKHSFKDSNNLSIYAEDFSFNKNVKVYPLWAIVIPAALILIFILSRLIKKKK
jgi:hypothetical protein